MKNLKPCKLSLRDHDHCKPRKHVSIITTSYPTESLMMDTVNVQLHFLLARNFLGSGYLAISTRVALLQIIVILKCIFF